MEIKEFTEKVCSELERRLGNNYRVERKDETKNNGIIRHGFMVIGRDWNVAPTIYLDTYLDAYKAGLSFESIIQSLLDICHKEEAKGRIDMNFFRSFEKVRDRICYCLIGKERNRELLEDIPYIEFLDLAICFYYAYHGDAIGDGTILIHNSHMVLWDTCTAELFGLAKRNTRRLFPWTCCSLAEILKRLVKANDNAEEEEEPFLHGVPLKVLSNEKRIQGSICLLYPGVLDSLAHKEGHNLYIIPSSIHEVILLPNSGKEPDATALKEMIREVNSTQVAPEEILSDNLYYYDATDKRVKIV